MSGAARVHVFPDSARLGRQIARAAGLAVARVGVHHFPDGESLVRIRHTRGADAILVRSLHDPNAKLLETLLAADALRRAGARRVTLVAPYLPYMRQDAVFTPGEPVPQRVVGDCSAGPSTACSPSRRTSIAPGDSRTWSVAAARCRRRRRSPPGSGARRRER